MSLPIPLSCSLTDHQFIQGLQRVNDELLQFVEQKNTTVPAKVRLRWDPTSHPWFPIVASS